MSTRRTAWLVLAVTTSLTGVGIAYIHHSQKAEHEVRPVSRSARHALTRRTPPHTRLLACLPATHSLYLPPFPRAPEQKLHQGVVRDLERLAAKRAQLQKQTRT